MPFSGSIVALATPFRNNKVDFQAIEKLVEFHISKGTSGVVPCGTTGEASTLTMAEHKSLLKFVVKTAAGRISVICGCGSNNTVEAAELVVFSEKIKADGILVVTPYYNRPTQEGLYRHYSTLARKVSTPMVLYNVPSRTGVNLAPETTARLAAIKNIVAVKEAGGSVEQVCQIIKQSGLTVLSGDDGMTLPFLVVGAKGVISVSANVVPDRIAALVASFLRGDLDEAKAIHYELLDLHKNLFIETNPIPVKTAMSLMGLIKKAEFRLPLCEMSPNGLAILRRTLADLKLIKK